MSAKIIHLKYKEIDFEKYDNCIKNAINSRVYAYSWYLDIVCNKDWELLILDDYHIVMPLPFKRIKKKIFKRMVEQPMFCQQLGVFFLSEITSNVFQLFLTKLDNLNCHTYSFNAENYAFTKNNNYLERVNYELNLNIPYEEIQKKYSKNLKRNIKKGLKNELKITSVITISDFILLKNENTHHKINKRQYDVMTKIIKQVKSTNFGKFYGIKKENKFIAIAFLIEHNHRIIHLFSTSSILGKKLGATPFLFNHIIKNNAHKNSIFDFEGSMNQGIAKFFSSFGSENNPFLMIN